MQHDDPKKTDEFIAAHIGKPIEGVKDSSSSKRLLNAILPPYRSRRKTAAALSIIASIFIGIIGMNSINTAWGENDNVKTGSRKSNIIVPTNTSAQDITSETQPESFESYQLRILRNQNHLQAEKIKALREELLEATQKLHELKPHLFKQGDPADQAKIAELTQMLGEKESLLNQVTSTKDQVEKDLAAARKKLNEMETVKEALAAMVEKQRTAKEQNLSNFKRQMEEIHASAEAEKSALLKKVQQHDAEYEKLHNHLAEKTQTINRLDNVATKLNSALADKNQELMNLEGQILSLYDEILLLTDIYSSSNVALNEQVQSLVAALDWEKTKTSQLQSFKDEMNWLSDIFVSTKAILSDEIDQLQASLEKEKAKNDELTLLKADLEYRRIELALLLDTHGSHKKEMDEYIQQLTAATEYEQTRTQELENEMLVLLSHQENSHRYAEALETLLGEMDDLLASKHEEMEVAAASHAQSVGTLLSHLDHSERAADHHQNYGLSLKEKFTAVLEKQKQKEENLQASLKEAMASYEKEKSRLANLEELFNETSLNAQALKLELLSQNIDLASKEMRIRQLESQQASAYQKLSGQISQLGSELNNESYYSLNAEALLHDTVDHAATLSETLSMHKAALEEKDKALQALHDNHNQIKQDLENQINRLRAELDDKSAHSLSLIEQVQSLHDKQNELLAGHDAHLLDKQDLAADIQSLKDELDEKSAYVQSLNDHIQALQDKQNELLAGHEGHQKEKQELATDIQSLKNELDEKTAYIHSLNDHIQALQDKQNELLQGHAGHQKEKQELAAEIQRLGAELDAKSSHNEALRDQIQLLLEKHSEQLDVDSIALESQDRSQNELHERIADLNRQLQELNNGLQSERDRASSLEHDLDEMLTKYDAEVGRSNELDDQIKVVQAALAEKVQMLSLLEGKVSTTDLDNHGLADENQKLREQVDYLAQAYQDSRAESAELASIIEQLREELSQSHVTQEGIVAFEELLRSQMEELDNKNNHIASLEESHANQKQDSAARHAALAEQLQKISDELAVEKSRSKILHDDLNFARSNYTRERSSSMNLDKLVKEAYAKVSQLEEQLEQHRIALDNKDSQVQNLMDAKAHLKSTLSELYQKKVSELQEELEARKNIQDELREAIANYHEAKARAEHLEGQLAALDEEQSIRQQLQADLEITQGRYEDILNHAQDLEQRVAALEQEKAALASTQDELERAQAEYSDLHAHAQELEHRLASLEDVSSRSASVQEELESTRAEYKVVNGYAQDLEQRVAALEEEKARFAAIQNELESLKHEYADLQKQAHDLAEQLDETRQFASEKERAHSLAEERTIKTLTHNLELSSENQRLLREKSQLEQKLQEHMRRLVDQTRQEVDPGKKPNDDNDFQIEQDTADDYNQSRLRRLNNYRSSSRP